MASGFLILQDGRAFSVRWSAHDLFLTAIADELSRTPDERAFAEWIRSVLPGPSDLEHLGHGPWLRSADEQIIDRVFDLRELTTQNQMLFHLGAQRAFARFITKQISSIPEAYLPTFARLLKMLKYVRQRRPPNELSDWRDGYTKPSTGNRVGPGW